MTLRLLQTHWLFTITLLYPHGVPSIPLAALPLVVGVVLLLESRGSKHVFPCSLYTNPSGHFVHPESNI